MVGEDCILAQLPIYFFKLHPTPPATSTVPRRVFKDISVFLRVLIGDERIEELQV